MLCLKLLYSNVLALISRCKPSSHRAIVVQRSSILAIGMLLDYSIQIHHLTVVICDPRLLTLSLPCDTRLSAEPRPPVGELTLSDSISMRQRNGKPHSSLSGPDSIRNASLYADLISPWSRFPVKPQFGVTPRYSREYIDPSRECLSLSPSLIHVSSCPFCVRSQTAPARSASTDVVFSSCALLLAC
jgi:hypothetical protein